MTDHLQDGVGDWKNDPYLARWGCFVPDLTRLASGASTTSLPRQHIMGTAHKSKLEPAKNLLNLAYEVREPNYE